MGCRKIEYVDLDPSKLYLKISDIAKDPDRSLINSSLLSWIFPANSSGAKIPHSSILVFGDEFEFTEDGIIKKSQNSNSEKVVQIHEFNNVLERDADELEIFIKIIRSTFNRSTYSLMNRNCNHFALKLLQFFGIDTEFLQALPSYGNEVVTRSAKVAGSVGGIGSLIGSGLPKILTKCSKFKPILTQKEICLTKAVLGRLLE